MLNGTLVFSFETEEHNGNVIGKQNEFTNKVDTDLHAHAPIQLCLQCSWLNSQLKFKWWVMGNGEYKTLNTDIAVNYSYNNKQTKYNKC